MHNNEPTATLLQVLRDLSRTIEQMAPQQTLTAIERDLLLTEMQQLYAQLLAWPVALPKVVAVEPVVEATSKVAAPVLTEELGKEPQTAEIGLHEQVAAVTEEVIEQLTEAVEEAVEEAMETGKEVEIDIQLQVSEKPEAVEMDSHDQTEAAPGEVVATQMETEKNPEPAAKPEVTTPAPVAPAPAVSSVAFSLSGVIQKSGDSQLVMAHLKLKPIDDLKSGIGLNEKFLFIRELFNNDHLAYADAIELLNACSSMEAAEQIIANQLLPQYHWDLETEAAVSFLHLIFRRFAPGA